MMALEERRRVGRWIVVEVLGKGGLVLLAVMVMGHKSVHD